MQNGQIKIGWGDSPCRGCKERCIEPNCHNTCKRYLEAKDAAQEIKRKAKDPEAVIYEKAKAARLKECRMKGRHLK